MQIDQEYRIEKYGYGVSLIKEQEVQALDKETRKPIDGKKSISKEVFYLGNVEQCLRTYLRLKVNDCKEVKDILTAIETANKNIAKQFKNFKI